MRQHLAGGSRLVRYFVKSELGSTSVSCGTFSHTRQSFYSPSSKTHCSKTSSREHRTCSPLMSCAAGVTCLQVVEVCICVCAWGEGGCDAREKVSKGPIRCNGGNACWKKRGGRKSVGAGGPPKLANSLRDQCISVMSCQHSFTNTHSLSHTQNTVSDWHAQSDPDASDQFSLLNLSFSFCWKPFFSSFLGFLHYSVRLSLW